jgi:hypothetical protein
MDDFFARFFFDEEPPEELPYRERPEIQDAIYRVLARKRHRGGYFVDFSEAIPTSNPHVKLLRITILFEKGSVSKPHDYVIWVDDFELVFRLVDDTW